MSVSIVVPCYNEAAHIEKVVNDYYDEVLSKFDDGELIVVDDCSDDASAAILAALKPHRPKLRILKTPVRCGHGLAIRIGYEAAREDWVFQVDGDDVFDVKDFWKLYERRGHYDFVLGFRKRRTSPFERAALSVAVRLVNYVFWGAWIRDANCPFRLIRRDILCDLLSHMSRKTIATNIFMSILSWKNQIRMTEVGAAYHQQRGEKSSLTGLTLMKFSFAVFGQLLELRKTRGCTSA